MQDLVVCDNAPEELAKSVTSEQFAEYKQIVASTEKALERLSMLDWHAIRDEKFFCAPPALYNELIPKAMELGGRICDNEERRARRLERALAEARREEGEEAEEGDEEVVEEPPAPARRVDKYGLRLDEFLGKDTHKRPKPYKFQQAIAQANEVAVNDMRTLLNLHYDAQHELCYRKQRPTEVHVYRAVAASVRARLNQTLTLPSSVRELLRSPEDEASWPQLEKLRLAVVAAAVREETVELLEEEEAEALACAIENAAASAAPGTVGSYPAGAVGHRVASRLPSGARVLPEQFPGRRRSTRALRLGGQNRGGSSQRLGYFPPPGPADFGRAWR